MTNRRITRQLAAQAMLLDASQFETFIIDFGTSVQSLSVKNVSPGQLYVFILRQDDNGNHSLNWGSSLRNAATLDAAPHAITVQSFIAATGGILYAIPPATWN